MAELPLIPSTVVGSHGKAGWWFTAVKAYEAGDMGPATSTRCSTTPPTPRSATWSAPASTSSPTARCAASTATSIPTTP